MKALARPVLVAFSLALLGGCATLERIDAANGGRDSEPEDVVTTEAERPPEPEPEPAAPLPASVTRAEPGEAPRALSPPPATASAPSLETENEQLRQQVILLQEQLQQQQTRLEQLQRQWTTNFSLMEQGVAESLRENQQLIAELQQNVQQQALTQAEPSAPAPTNARQAPTPPPAPKISAAPPAPPPRATPPQELPLVEEVSLANLRQGQTSPAPPPPTTASTQRTEPPPVVREPEPEAPFTDPDLEEPENPLVLVRQPGVKNLYNQGMAAFIQGSYDDAVNLFEQLVTEHEQDPDSDNAWYWIGYAKFRQEKWDEAETAFRQVLRQYEHRPTSQGFKTPDAIYMLGQIAEADGQTSRARYYYEAVAERFPGSAAANNANEELSRLLGEG